MELGTFMSQLWATIQSLGTLSPLLQVAAVITVLISAWKTSAFQPLWTKLGKLQAYVAPVLAILFAIVTSLASGGTLSLATVFSALVVGLTSVGFHELLEAIKSAPWIGKQWAQVITWFESLLGGTDGRPLKTKIARFVKLPAQSVTLLAQKV